MFKKTILITFVFAISLYLAACSFDNVMANVEKKLTNESDAELNGGIQNRNLERVKEAIEDGANLNIIRESLLHKENPVILALLQNQNTIAQYLIENGADVNYADRRGSSILMFSAYNTDVSFCEFLIKHGAKVNHKDKKGYTALECVLDHSRKATSENDINTIVTMLLQNGGKIRSVTLKAAMNGGFSDGESRYGLVNRIAKGLISEGRKTGLNHALEAAITGDSVRVRKSIQKDQIRKEDEQQILFYTAAFGEAETMKLLEDKGIDIKACDNYKNTTLIIAAQYGNLEMVKYLLNIGLDLEAENKDNNTALLAAIMNGNYETTQYLLKYGAKTQFVIRGFINDSFGALDEAAGNNNVQIMDLLFANGYPLNSETLSSALSSAISRNKKEAIEYLLKKGADPNKLHNGNAPLEDACLLTDVDTVRMLVEHGAKVNGTGGKDNPLCTAVQYGGFEIVRYLLENGANANRVTKYDDGSSGEPALMRAAYCGELDSVKLLIEYGADVNYRDKDSNGDTALIGAAGACSRNMKEYLIQKGADIDYQNDNGETALMRAASMGETDCVKVLLKYKANVDLKNKDGKTAYDLAKSGYNFIIIELLKDNSK